MFLRYDARTRRVIHRSEPPFTEPAPRGFADLEIDTLPDGILEVTDKGAIVVIPPDPEPPSPRAIASERIDAALLDANVPQSVKDVLAALKDTF